MAGYGPHALFSHFRPPNYSKHWQEKWGMAQLSTPMSDLESLISCVPALVVRRLAAQGQITPPAADRFPAAVMFADISGFTALAEQLSQAFGPPAGAEQLADILNAHFNQFIELIGEHGGEVVKFAGDALVVLWPARYGPGPSFGEEKELAAVTGRAIQCALSLQQAMRAGQIVSGLHLDIQIGIAAGYVSAVHLGGILGRVEFMLSGSPMAQMSQALALARPGQIILAPDAYRLVKEGCDGQWLPGDYLQLEGITTAIAIQPAVTPALEEQFRPALQSYIPAAAISRLQAGQAQWAAELRQATILFIHLPSYGTSIKHPYQRTLPQAQAVMTAMQTAIYRYEGSINKLNVDNKGITLVAAFGLPPLHHENDAIRGLQAAMDLQLALRQLGRRNAIGVTTGQVFCGIIGHERRREYTMVGDAVNMASRLAEVVQQIALPAETALAILCDEATHRATNSHILFDALPPALVKGKVEPVAIFRPRFRASHLTFAARPEPGKQTPSQQNQATRPELQPLIEQIQRLRQPQPTNPKNLIILESEAGLGKSWLADTLLIQAQRQKIVTLVGQTNALERASPFHAWGSIFDYLFQLGSLRYESLSKQQAHVLSQLPAATHERGYPALALRYAPLLNAVLPLQLPDNAFTGRLTDQERQEAGHHFLLRLLQLILEKRKYPPVLLLFEDIHLLDSASLRLLVAVSQTIPKSLCLATTRPVPSQTPLAFRLTAYRQLLAAGNCQRVRLSPIEPQEMLALVGRYLGVSQLPEPVANLLRQKGQGNLFFCQLLAAELRQAGLLTIQRGSCQLTGDEAALENLPVPPAIQSIILSTVDYLSPTCQMVLKTASVLGDHFSLAQLNRSYPLPAGTDELVACLQELENLGLVLESPGRNSHYHFKYQFVRQVVSQSLLTRQRERLMTL